MTLSGRSNRERERERERERGERERERERGPLLQLAGDDDVQCLEEENSLLCLSDSEERPRHKDSYTKIKEGSKNI